MLETNSFSNSVLICCFYYNNTIQTVNFIKKTISTRNSTQRLIAVDMATNNLL